ncbi:cation:proton antiporter (plasmid) [Verrucomicrobiaceae bacterium 227]
MNHFFEELLIILAASLIACLVFGRLKLPTIVAYMIAGAIIGPHAIGLVGEPEDFSFLAEFGVVFLLFALGLEFSLSRLIQIRRIVFGLGFLQVTACVVVFAAAVYFWGCSLEASVIIAGALALSSTAIVTRELGEHRQMNKRYAQLSIGVLLFQDLIALVFLILVPVLAAAQETSFGGSLLSALGRGVLLLAILMSVGRWVLPFLYGEISKTRSQEVFVLATLVIGMMAAWLTHELHLSMTLGGFIIGMMLGESDFKHQIEIDLRPFKDILLGLFFVTMGMSIEVELLVEYWPRLLFFTMALIVIKMGIVAVVVNMMGDTKRNALRTGITLSQAGEFGLALLALSNKSGVVPEEQASFIIILALLSMAASAVLIRKSEVVTDWLLPLLPLTGKETSNGKDPSQIKLHESDHVIIGGFGRVGQTIASVLDENDIPYIAIENDSSRVKRFRKSGVNIVYGDCNNTDFLKSCHIDSARLAILTFRFHDAALHTLKRIRNSECEIPVILRCHEVGQLEELVSLGASYVVPEMLETRLLIADQVLNILQISPDLIERQIDRIRKEAVPAVP